MNALRFILFPFATLYWLITSFRNFLFNRRILKSNSFDLPVVCIGNLSMGGTGKTPHCEYLITLLKEDYNTALLSRGYGRKTNEFIEVEVTHQAWQVGDEPLQIKNKFPALTVAVDRKRVNGVINLLYNYPNKDVILLDDAFQHRAIKAGFNILLTKFNAPFNSDYIFPVGNLREARKGHQRADVIIITKCPKSITKDQMDSISSEISKTIPVYFTKINYGETQSIFDNSKIQLDSASKVLLITGIADHSSITKKLNNEEIKFKHLAFRDHYPFSEKDADKVSEIFDKFATNNKIILTTEKDAMRLKNIEAFKKLPIYFIPIKIEFIAKEKEFHHQLLTYVSNNK